MSDKSSLQHVDTNCVAKILKMTHKEQEEWLSALLDHVKKNGLEEDFFAAALNILSESTIEDVKNWYYSKKEL
ncbi:hypothetical protein [Lactococcus garvieae]|uniref:hypothetical protein n=1 Tax=Lactococcus garvieae TaxID=1363 RepID=UPI003851873A